MAGLGDYEPGKIYSYTNYDWPNTISNLTYTYHSTPSELADKQEKSMEEYKGFKVGDRVRVEDTFWGEELKGKVGTIKLFHPRTRDVGVEFDEKFTAGHDLDGNCKSGYGRYGLVGEITKINKTTMIKKLSNFIKKAVDADTQELLKAGFINGDLAPTYEGEAALKEINWFANHEALVKLAKEKNAETEAAEKKA